MSQLFKFPMEYLRVTQGELDSYSHGGSLAMDFGGKDTGADKLYCPCDMVVKRCRQNANGEMYLESISPVKFADGTTDYARLLCVHDSAFNATEGSILKQGDYFYDEGGMGSGNPNKFGTHCHIEAGKGKWKSCTQSPNSKGVYVIENQSHLYDLFILGNDVQILNGGGYNWKTVAYIENEKVKQPDGTMLAADFSKHQGVIDWSKIQNRGIIKAVGLRTGYGDSIEGKEDEQFKSNMQGSIALNIPIWHYHFIYSQTEQEAVTEAEFAATLLNPYRDKITGLVFWDYEYDAMNYLSKNYGFTSPKEQVQKNCLAFCNRLRELGFIPGIYTNKDLFNRFYSDDFIKENDLKLWLADPNNSTPWHTCDIWQYEVSNGAEWGIDKNIDKDIVFINFERLEKAEIEEKDCENCEKVKEQSEEIERLKNMNTDLNNALKSLNVEYQKSVENYETEKKLVNELNVMYAELVEKFNTLTQEHEALKNEKYNNILKNIIEFIKNIISKKG